MGLVGGSSHWSVGSNGHDVDRGPEHLGLIVSSCPGTVHSENWPAHYHSGQSWAPWADENHRIVMDARKAYLQGLFGSLHSSGLHGHDDHGEMIDGHLVEKVSWRVSLSGKLDGSRVWKNRRDDQNDH